MLGQSSAASCGPCAVSNGLKALGLDVSEAEVLRWMDRIRQGADPGSNGANGELMTRAMAESRYRLRIRRLSTGDRDYATLVLRGAVGEGAIAIAYVDSDGDEQTDDGHWVAVVGLLGRRVLVADGADRELVLSYDEDQFLARWSTPGFYAVIVSRRAR